LADGIRSKTVKRPRIRADLRLEAFSIIFLRTFITYLDDDVIGKDEKARPVREIIPNGQISP